MKILKKGKKPSGLQATAECQECDCKFRFAQSEARFFGDPRDGDAYVVNCPECKHENWVSVDLFR